MKIPPDHPAVEAALKKWLNGPDRDFPGAREAMAAALTAALTEGTLMDAWADKHYQQALQERDAAMAERDRAIEALRRISRERWDQPWPGVVAREALRDLGADEERKK